MGVFADSGYIYLANFGDGIRVYTFNGTNFTLKDHRDDNGGFAQDVHVKTVQTVLANDDDGLRGYTFDGVTLTPAGSAGTGDDAEGLCGWMGVGWRRMGRGQQDQAGPEARPMGILLMAISKATAAM